MTNALTVLATSSTDLATTLNLRPGFADSVVDYDYDMTKRLIDPFRHVKFVDEISGHPDYPDHNILMVRERVTMIHKFLAHDYGRALKAMLERPTITEQEITRVAQFIVSGMPMAQNMRPEVVMLDAADVIRQGVHYSGRVIRPSLWMVELARTELVNTVEFYTTKAFQQALTRVIRGTEQLRTCLTRLETKPEKLLIRCHEHIEFLEENYKAKCYPGNEPSLLTTDPELATAVHEITGHTTWYVPSDNIEKLIDILPGKKFLLDGDEDLLNSMEQQYPDRIIATVPAKAEKLRERRDEFREWVGSTSDQVNWRR